jgi:hypothetical protein
MRGVLKRSAVIVLSSFFTSVAHAAAEPGQDENALRELVAVSIVRDGRAILLATPGLHEDGRSWRFRSLDTSELPQPIRSVSLSASGTKLFIQFGDGPGGVLDLTRQYRHHVPLQYVTPGDLAIDGRTPLQSHRLPGQRFVSLQDGMAYVVDDSGRRQPEYRAVPAVRSSIDAGGVVLHVRADGSMAICGEDVAHRDTCRELSRRVAPHGSLVLAQTTSDQSHASRPRFAVLTRDEGRITIVDPESPQESDRRASGAWTEASLRAYVTLNGLTVPDERITAHAEALVKESAQTWAAEEQPLTEWQFFHMSVDPSLYAPVLELSRLETVFPSSFETLEQLGTRVVRRGQSQADLLYDRYLRQGVAAHRAACNYYVTTQSTAGSWLLEYWLYYPFDVGGLGSHPHDPEHIFVEVDKLGGDVRRVIGAGHGYMAGNNMFTAGHAGAAPIQLPLFAIVELGKHASAPDVDRDGVFTPGIDENTYNERAKVWGVRDVIGTMNNQFPAYDASMSGVRRPNDYLAPAPLATRYPDDPDVVAAAHCTLTPLPGPGAAAGHQLRVSDWFLLAPCDALTSDCAGRHVTAHPDYLDPQTILKEWNFPSSFLRASYGLGPRKGLHSVGLGYAMDMESLPGIRHALPLPGRLGADVFFWDQPTSTAGAPAPAKPDDRDSCPGRHVADGQPYCPVGEGVGWDIRYEQFLSNLFGIYSSVRVFSPPVGDAWITFGPFVESSIGRRANAMIQGGLSFRPYESPRFEMKVSVGVWKPKSHRIGIEAAGDHAR